MGGTLPIELLYFNGLSENSIIKLHWATTNEDNFHFFTLEKSSNAYDFHPLINIMNKGGLSQIQEYSYIDEAPFPDLNYYRLKAVDYDGSIEYHPIIGIKFEGEQQQKILIYPNPLSGPEMTVRPNFEFDKASIRIKDVTGKNIANWIQNYPSQTFSIPNNINPGIYLVEFTSTNGSHKQRIEIN